MLGLVLVPGLLAAGIGMLTFVGLDNLTGFGTFSLAIPGVPPFDRPTLALFGWAIVFGLLAPILGRGIQLLAVAVRARVEPRMVLLMPVVGLGITGLAIGFGEATGHSASNVLFSGQDDLGPMIGGAAGWVRRGAGVARALQGTRVRAGAGRSQESRASGHRARTAGPHDADRRELAGPLGVERLDRLLLHELVELLVKREVVSVDGVERQLCDVEEHVLVRPVGLSEGVDLRAFDCGDTAERPQDRPVGQTSGSGR